MVTNRSGNSLSSLLRISFISFVVCLLYYSTFVGAWLLSSKVLFPSPQEQSLVVIIWEQFSTVIPFELSIIFATVFLITPLFIILLPARSLNLAKRVIRHSLLWVPESSDVSTKLLYPTTLVWVSAFEALSYSVIQVFFFNFPANLLMKNDMNTTAYSFQYIFNNLSFCWIAQILTALTVYLFVMFHQQPEAT